LFTQAEDLALDCFVDILPFKNIATFHIYLASMEGNTTSVSRAAGLTLVLFP